MNGSRFVVAAGEIEQLLARTRAAVIERAAHAVLLEVAPDEVSALSGAGTRVSVFRNPAIARTAFGVYAR
jgi:hypothetical protein